MKEIARDQPIHIHYYYCLPLNPPRHRMLIGVGCCASTSHIPQLNKPKFLHFHRGEIAVSFGRLLEIHHV